MVSRRTRKEAKSRSRSSTTLSEVLNHEAKKKRAKLTGIHKRYRLSPELAKLIGSNEPETRYNVVKLIWIQIKERKLQDPEDPAYIDCDEEFESVTVLKKYRKYNRLIALADLLHMQPNSRVSMDGHTVR
ncbi:protein TRI1-like [Ctenocephalides felis]|uniref:protein TRI1-like n=1 Tax=Ctenocephalides felis TaxID=7515 RepID=UPI000E6E26B2|nr:protein TRI1-like [Ctenocephalides felis]